jgi:hypothetical protein
VYKIKTKASFVQVLAKSVQKKQGLCHHIVTLPFYIIKKKYLKAKEELPKHSNISPSKNYNLPKIL